MDTLITVIHVIVCVFLVLVVLLQAGKGGGMGIAFGGAGGGGGGSVFGGSGAGNFLTKLTVISAFMFMFTSMTLAYLASSGGDDPLKALSAKSRAAAKEREEQRKKILEPDEAPDAVDGEGDVAPEDVAPEDGVSVPGDEATDPAPEPATPEPEPEPAPAGAPQ